MLRKAETDVPKQVFDTHDFALLLGADDGCTAGCCAGVLDYRQTEFLQGGVHEDQEVFFVLEGSGEAKIGQLVFPIREGTAFVAPAGQRHFIRRSPDCSHVKLFFVHAAAK